MGRPVSRVGKVVVTGPLAPFAAALKAWLEASGYTPLSAVNVLRLMGHVSCWLEAGGLTVADLDTERVTEYVRARLAAGYTFSCSEGSLRPLLAALAAEGVLPADPAPAAGSSTEVMLGSFRRYLLNERGLAASTAAAYVRSAGRFLAGLGTDGLAGVTSADVTRTVLDASRSMSVGSTQCFVAALRSFLRFGHIEGRIEADLSAAALAITGRRSSSLPQGLARAEVRALLGSCDRRRADGRRDYALLLTVVRLGLRAGEVAGLTLDDIDWRSAEIVVHGKGRRVDRLPLPDDVGAAIAGYLQRGRPRSSRREVFLRTLAPIGPLGRGGVSCIVRRACRRAGLVPVGAHRLRHTMACDMVAVGVPLPEISQVLRHRSLISTAIYARVDLDQLRGLARPWPGTAGPAAAGAGR